jgi:hypothetical protein
MTSDQLDQLRDHASELRECAGHLESACETFESRDSEIDAMQTRYLRLFNGDLSKLDWSDRMELFRAISRIGSHESATTLARIDSRL